MRVARVRCGWTKMEMGEGTELSRLSGKPGALRVNNRRRFRARVTWMARLLTHSLV